MDKQPEKLTVQEAAQVLDVKSVSLYEAMREGRLPYEEVFGRKVIARADLEAYQARTRVDGEKPKGRPKGSANRKKNSEAEAGQQS